MLTVYHGSTQTVDAPVCAFGRPRLDFGQGFYVTDIKEQAERWAKAIAGKRDTEPVLNIISTVNRFYRRADARFSLLIMLIGLTLLWQTDVAKTLQPSTII